jgi:hypothetical protein
VRAPRRVPDATNGIFEKFFGPAGVAFQALGIEKVDKSRRI